ncbi:flagellin, flagellar filament structural protein [Marinobacter nauticus ATCC 49840]|uniref:flagellin N-terminal helical domain-containing protein n=1 Tax=Marinobacter nauticus TaxID=2743 RepID=UPI000256E943|nr:flagellin [Marinobacter nauticus]MCG8524090.1 flagellin [Pseudomonadales bacterium]TPW24834.1 flagellin [Marinobacter nauticus]CCG95974.1 flagellin, flagellar filament structural protein [Marinobacter nauticus ATCC 49840]
MALGINTNVASLSAQNQLNKSQNQSNQALERLSSGLRINSAKDDAAGLAISNRFEAQIRGLNQATRNANDGISLAQTAEGALGEAGNILQRVRELAVQSANASNSSSDRQALQDEVNQLVSELDRIATTTNFNGQKLFDGTFGSAQFQVGANANETISASTSNLRTDKYGNNQVIASGAAAGTAASGGGAVNGVSSGSVAINGYLGSETISVAANATSKDIAADINSKTADTGVTATARTEVDLAFAASGSYTLNLTADNSEAQSVSFTIDATSGQDSLSAAVAAINDQSSKTGITAEVAEDGASIVLTNETGADIVVGDTGVQNAGNVTITKQYRDDEGALQDAGAAATLTADTTAEDVATSGYLQLDSDRSFAVDVTSSNAFADTGSELRKVSDLDISSFESATQALKTVDAALNTINSQRAKFGAIQSRFESTISNLESTSTNLSAAQSRILDADFAAETAKLSKAQVLQQAGISVLAQANARPQQVLSLLQ